MAVMRYSLGELYGIRDTMANYPAPRTMKLPPELKRRKRGRRSGCRVRNNQRKFKPVLPSVIMGNVRSLANKVDELAALVKYDRMFRQCSLLCFTESWLNDNVPAAYTEMDGFTMIRHDRDLGKTGKCGGGGVCMYINKQWCHPGHVTEKRRVCDQNIELLVVSCRPYYIPREFSNVIVMVAYIAPSANAKLATDTIARATHDLLSHTPDALVIINGDFNHCSLSSSMPSFKQFVTCPTRSDRTIDLFYANVRDSYYSTALPPLGRSDHNLVLLSNNYTMVARKLPRVTRTVRVWSQEACEELQACLECTDWTVFYDGHGPLSRGEPIPGRPALHKEKRTLPGAPAGFTGIRGSEPDSLSIDRGRRSNLTPPDGMICVGSAWSSRDQAGLTRLATEAIAPRFGTAFANLRTD
ncbi:hypothetical protein N1851_028369 [Merluccius polli]|uniref:Endonuclease/exonuclease/phosphatase domain-containing protein n=1 Tax=Merluccius polli TaxID=89951 RepID=A0AA47M8Z7_MERPO|nr:hypothetical protein N1851_028369 [Merluccius polli]